MKEQQPTTKTASSSVSAWTDIIGSVVPLLWFCLATIAFVMLYPLAASLLRDGDIKSIKVGVLEVELARVRETTKSNAIEVAKESVLMSREARKRLSDRFKAQRQDTEGATVLWVDDGHPYQNVTERRVLEAAGMSVDLARNTDEAIKWLIRSHYDFVITDLDRRAISDPSVPCYGENPQPANAGCALLKTVGQCFEGPADDLNCVAMRAVSSAKAPTMFVYAGDVRKEWGTPPFAKGATNKADELFAWILDAARNRPAASALTP